MSNKSDVMQGFTRIGKDVYVPENVSPFASEDGPDYVIVFGWMGAQLAHLRKYLDQYKTLYPDTNAILVISRPEHFFHGTKKQEESLAPLLSYFKREGLFDGKASLLVHAFSNGGAVQLTRLSTMIERSKQLGPRALAFVFDSLPGETSLSTAVDAFTIGFKGPVVKVIAYVAFALLFFVFHLVHTVTGAKFPIEQTRQILNDPHLLPGASENTPRLYLFSDKDRLVPVTAVESHIADAKQLGLNVRAAKLLGSQHVQHSRTHPDEYWTAVRETWEKAKKLSRS
ncbi:unnamed protein product [Somion occarium]|uniref:Uncharacterized protein n=1 Tax=Somion occarium TaxID=3059160 RepID=A0ABP1CLC4_9APHY